MYTSYPSKYRYEVTGFVFGVMFFFLIIILHYDDVLWFNFRIMLCLFKGAYRVAH